MDRLDSMVTFVRVVELGSFSSVAKEMNTTQPTISKRIAELESWLGAKLLNRSTRSLHLTETGADYYERCVGILHDVEEAETSAGNLQSSPKGTLRINTMTAFGRLHIIPLLNDFQQQYPNIQTEIMLNDQVIDLIQEGVDVAIRMGELQDSNLMAKKICQCPWTIVASKEYLDTFGRPSHPRELKQHQCIIYSGMAKSNHWKFQENGQPLTVSVQGNFKTNNSEGYRAGLRANLGIGRAPGWLIKDLVASEQLIPILQDYYSFSHSIYAIYPPGRHTPNKVRRFIDFLDQQFQAAECFT
ncbi:MAG: LysR family transcriptional regulator [Gammaproteobacteria bacterium]|nr:MAG: LysR family transcriptional regulator [Gammaproteobacteria bacterium]